MSFEISMVIVAHASWWQNGSCGCGRDTEDKETYREEVLQHHATPHITLAWSFAGFKANGTSKGCTGSACAPEESTTSRLALPQHLTTLHHERRNIPQRDMQRLVASIRRRCHLSS